MKLTLNLPKKKALWFYHHLKKEHPIYSRTLEIGKPLNINRKRNKK